MTKALSLVHRRDWCRVCRRAQSPSQDPEIIDALAAAGVRHSSCKSFTARTGGGPLLIMCGRVALDRAAAQRGQRIWSRAATQALLQAIAGEV